MKERWIALLGRCDKPTDAVEDYCKFLSEALRGQDVDLRLERVDWDTVGWDIARAQLQCRAAAWRGAWVLVQYTALAWSAHGFPSRILGILKILLDCAARITVVYHDVEPYGGRRLVDRLRRIAQMRTMRRAMRMANVSILTVPPDKVSWLGAGEKSNVIFIPVGANLPLSPASNDRKHTQDVRGDRSKTVAVFGVTGGEAGQREVPEIAAAACFAAARVPRLRLVILGRHSEDVETQLRDALKGAAVELSVLGLLPAEEVVRALGAADVLLLVRGAISSRRGSAIAGFACGLPVIASAGSETAAPIIDAGVAFYSREAKDEPGATLARVLTDESYRATLAEKSRRAYEDHFSWRAIAKMYSAALRGELDPR